MSNINPRDFDPTVDGHLRGAIGESQPVPIHASVVTAQARRQRRIRTIAGSIAGLAGGLAVIVAAAVIVPGMMPAPAMQGVPAPMAQPTPELTTEPTPDVTAEPTPGPAVTIDPGTDPMPAPTTGEPVPTSPPTAGTTPPAPPSANGPLPSCGTTAGPVTPDKTWTTYTMANVGVSVMLPKGIKAYLDKDFDNGWRLDSFATHAGTEPGGGIKEILVWPESLAAGPDVNSKVKDLGVVPGLTTDSGDDVHVGLIVYPEFREVLLMTKGSSGGWTELLDFGKGNFYLGSDDNWDPMPNADCETVVAILASVKRA